MKTTKSLLLVFQLLWLATAASAQTTEVFTFGSLNKGVPDGTPAGLVDSRNVSSAIENLASVRVRLNVTGDFSGDLYAYLLHVNPVRTNICILLNRSGRTSGNPAGYSDAGFSVTFDNAAGSDIHLYRAVTNLPPGAQLIGAWQPDGRNTDPMSVLDSTPRTTSLTSFAGASGDGEWTLFIADMDTGASHQLMSWELELKGAVAPAITWSNPTDIIYGAALSSIQLNASAGAVAGTYTYTPAAGTILNAGSAQPLSVLFTPTDTANYAPVTAKVWLNVLKRTLVVRGDNTNKLYGAVLAQLTASYIGFVASDTTARLTSLATVGTLATSTSAAGTYAITPSGVVSSNYNPAYVNGTLTVDKAPLTITANNASKPYGVALPTFTAAYTGFVAGDTPASLSPQATFTSSATAASPVGTYPIIPGGAGSPNYTISYVNGILNVDKAALTITANNTAKSYGAAVPILSASFTGFVNNDTTNSLTTQPVIATAASANSPVGSYAITASGAASPNYTISYANGTLTVGKATLTVIANDTNKLYGAAVPVFTATYAGFVAGDTAASLNPPVGFTTTATMASGVGEYPIIPGGASNANYTISYIPGALTVGKAPLTIVANDTNKLYGAAVPLLGATFIGFVNGDTTTSLTTQPTLATPATAASPAGTYPITAGGAVSANYALNYGNGTLTVGKATLTITANAANKVFGAPLPTFSASYTGFVGSDTVSSLTTPATLSTSATASSPAGSYPISPGGAASPNYTFNYVNGTLTITKASSTGTLATSKNPALPGASVTFRFTAAAVAPGAGTPDGTVTFRADGTAVGTAALSGGVAQYSSSTLSVGLHTVAADYAGSGNFLGSSATLSPSQLINTPPVAGADSILRYPTSGAKIEIATLLANDTDADGDAITLVDVSSSSAQGGTVAVEGDWIFYAPPNGFTNTDSFTYRITDGRGLPVTGTVSVQLKPEDGQALNMTIADLGNGTYRLRFYGIPNRSCRIDFSPAVQPPSWQMLTSGTADAYGVFECSDRPPGGIDARFYRAVYP